MSTLRNRIALLLVGSIVTVVLLATFAARTVLGGPLPKETMEPVAIQLQALLRLAASQPPGVVAPGVEIRTAPADGAIDGALSVYLGEAMRRTGAPRKVDVVEHKGSTELLASVALENGRWLIAPLPRFGPPRNGLPVLAGWLGLIILGSTLVAIAVARRVTRPLLLIEEAAANVRADGLLNPLPEDGPAELRATARALNRLSTRLRAAMSSRMRLVAAAGHDLRTPMTRMRLRAEFVADENERSKWLADLEELDVIADSAIRLVREEVEPDSGGTIEIGSLVRETVRKLAEAGLQVSMGTIETGTVRGGQVALGRALGNLLRNAATHGGGASISVENDDHQIMITVRDEGPGIPEADLERVFEPFFRVDPGRRKTIPGAGLGMAIAKEIVERFGGNITVQNVTPRGLLQTVVLPISPPE